MIDIIIVIVVLVTIYLVSVIKKDEKLKILNKIPGPKGIPLVGNTPSILYAAYKY